MPIAEKAVYSIGDLTTVFTEARRQKAENLEANPPSGWARNILPHMASVEPEDEVLNWLHTQAETGAQEIQTCGSILDMNSGYTVYRLQEQIRQGLAYGVI